MSAPSGAIWRSPAYERCAIIHRDACRADRERRAHARERPARRARSRTSALVLACQFAILALFLGAWEYVTSPTAPDRLPVRLAERDLRRFSQTMAMDGSLARDTYVTALETLLGFLLGNADRNAARACPSGIRPSSRASSSPSSSRSARSRSSRSPRW